MIGSRRPHRKHHAAQYRPACVDIAADGVYRGFIVGFAWSIAFHNSSFSLWKLGQNVETADSSVAIRNALVFRTKTQHPAATFPARKAQLSSLRILCHRRGSLVPPAPLSSASPGVYTSGYDWLLFVVSEGLASCTNGFRFTLSVFGFGLFLVFNAAHCSMERIRGGRRDWKMLLSEDSLLCRCWL